MGPRWPRDPIDTTPLSSEVKWQENAADRSPYPSADVTMCAAVPPLPHTPNDKLFN